MGGIQETVIYLKSSEENGGSRLPEDPGAGSEYTGKTSRRHYLALNSTMEWWRGCQHASCLVFELLDELLGRRPPSQARQNDVDVGFEQSATGMLL